MSIFLPNDNDNYQTIDNYLLNIHIDFSNDDSTFIIHEIKSSLIELRGESFNVDLNFLEFNYLLQDAAANVDDTNAILSILYSRYRTYIQSHTRSFRNNFVGYIENLLINEYEDLKLHNVNNKVFLDDLDKITNIIHEILTEERYILRFVI